MQLRATWSERSQSTVQQVTWNDLGKFSIPALAKKYKERAPLAWFLAESMAAPQKAGKIMVRERRPYGTVVVGALSAFAFAQNKMANYLALNIGIWQFSCKAHIDLKRIFSRFGYSVHDTTVHKCLNSLADSSLTELRKDVAEGVARGEVTWKYILDNVQWWDTQREHCIGCQANMKVGTAATVLKPKDCAPGAFNLADHLECVMKMERENMTTWSVFSDIDWQHQNKIQALHWLQILVRFIDELANIETLSKCNGRNNNLTSGVLPHESHCFLILFGPTHCVVEMHTYSLLRSRWKKAP
ncbi:hypothetical protein DXG01_004674 [Tephrocybe rancida]|nr:hypothetical protein DXG01_004674 [Tephrocybe rancida]